MSPGGPKPLDKAGPGVLGFPTNADGSFGLPHGARGPVRRFFLAGIMTGMPRHWAASALACLLPLGAAGPALAQDGAEGGSALVAMASVSPGGFDYVGLNHFFDAARVHLQAVLSPKDPPPDERQAKAAPEVRIVVGPDRAAPSKPRSLTPVPLIPAPAETPAYRRTFRNLLSHPEITDRYDEIILRNSAAFGLDARLLKSIIAAESEFFFGALSPRGAKGLMQVMPTTAEEMGIPGRRLSEPEYNIAAGAAYLARLFSAAFRRYKLRGVRFADAPLWLIQRIVAAYNAGPRFLFHNHWFRQTRHYVRKVLLFYGSQVTDFRRAPRALGDYPQLPASHSLGTLY